MMHNPRVPLRQVASLEAACDRYRLQEEEWQNKLGQSDGQARVILVMSEQVCLNPKPPKPVADLLVLASTLSTTLTLSLPKRLNPELSTLNPNPV
jgi:hypothetical protein